MTDTQTTPGGIAFVRTPDERFDGIDDFAYEPRYVEVDGLRMAYVDEGPPEAAPVLLLHGEPTWGYLYRRMIPFLPGLGRPDRFAGGGRGHRPL